MTVIEYNPGPAAEGLCSYFHMGWPVEVSAFEYTEWMLRCFDAYRPTLALSLGV